MIYPIIALFLVATHAFTFYKGYNYADNKAELEQARAKITQLEISERYYREANNASQSEAIEAAKSLEANLETVNKLNKIIGDITENPVCVDKEVVELIRELK